MNKGLFYELVEDSFSGIETVAERKIYALNIRKAGRGYSSLQTFLQKLLEKYKEENCIFMFQVNKFYKKEREEIFNFIQENKISYIVESCITVREYNTEAKPYVFNVSSLSENFYGLRLNVIGLLSIRAKIDIPDGIRYLQFIAHSKYMCEKLQRKDIIDHFLGGKKIGKFLINGEEIKISVDYYLPDNNNLAVYPSENIAVDGLLMLGNPLHSESRTLAIPTTTTTTTTTKTALVFSRVQTESQVDNELEYRTKRHKRDDGSPSP